MNLRDRISSKSAVWLADKITDYESLSKLLSVKRHKEYKLLTKEEITEIFEYAFKSVYGETSKILIIWLLAYLFNIFTPVFAITLVFAFLRASAGGVHMDTYLQCLISTSIVFLGAGYITDLINRNKLNTITLIFILIITYIISVLISVKYAPRDTVTKRITNPIEIQKYKKNTLISISFLMLISIVLIILEYNQLIILSIITAILLEIFMITPMAVYIFASVKKIMYKRKR